MIRNYHGFHSWQVKHELNEDLSTNYTFGIELEVQRNGSETSCETMSNLLENIEGGDLFIHEKDSSIGDGFEIISHPMTWEFFNNNIARFEEMFSLLNKHGFRSHNGGACGLHIHVGKKGIGISDYKKEWFRSNGVSEQFIQNENVLEVARTTTNINFVLERFKEEMFRFSRRKKETQNRWAKNLCLMKSLENGKQFIDKEEIENYTNMAIKNGGDRDRYRALNLKNSSTIEFRLFRGTLKWNTFYNTMNLVNNIVINSKREGNVVSFHDLVTKGLKPKQKKACLEYCEERGIVLDKDKVVVIGVKKEKPKRYIDKTALLNEILNA